MRPFLLLVFTLMSFADATTFRLEPRLELPPNTLAYEPIDCMEGAARIDAVGEVMSSIATTTPHAACYLSQSATGEFVSRYFEKQLSQLGYTEQTENDRAPDLYSSKWAIPEGIVLSFVWLTSPPSGVLTFVSYDDGNIIREQAGDVATDALNIPMGEAKNHPDESAYLKQETRFPLPLGTLELPADRCEPGLAQAIIIEFPLLSCYAMPLKPAQLLAKLDSQLTSLGMSRATVPKNRPLLRSIG